MNQAVLFIINGPFNVSKIAKMANMSPQYLSDIIAGRRTLSENKENDLILILSKYGYKKSPVGETGQQNHEKDKETT